MYMDFLTCSFPYWGRISLSLLLYREKSIKIILLVTLSPLSKFIPLHRGKKKETSLTSQFMKWKPTSLVLPLSLSLSL